jgi:hypothetical protein
MGLSAKLDQSVADGVVVGNTASVFIATAHQVEVHFIDEPFWRTAMK